VEALEEKITSRQSEAIPVNPNGAATSAMTSNIAAHFNILITS
jgi:hypothetical protein